jgi:hypothetical protein
VHPGIPSREYPAGVPRTPASGAPLRGALLAFPVGNDAADAYTRPEIGGAGIRCNGVVNVDEPGEVEELASRTRRAGAMVTDEPVEMPGLGPVGKCG